MNRKGLALTTLVAAMVVAAGGNPTPSTGQTQDGPGLTYGGLKDRYSAWLRLDPSRRAIASMQMDWTVARERCSNRKPYSSTLYAGHEEFHPISVSEDGKFQATVVDRYTYQGTRYLEHQALVGTIGPTEAIGAISGRVKITKPDGRVVRCTFGPQPWRLSN